MPDPLQTLTPESASRFDAALAAARESWNRLKLQHRIMMTIATLIETTIPSWLQLGPIAQFLNMAKFFDLQFGKLAQSFAWFDSLPEWYQSGKVSLRPSQLIPGEIDAVIQSDTVPVPPFAQEVDTLGSLWIAFGVIAGLAGLKVTTDYLSVQEATTQKQLDFLMTQKISEAVTSGKMTEATAARLIELNRGWKKAAEPEPDTLDKLTTLLKWGVGIALGIAGVNMVLRMRDQWKAGE